MIGFDPGRHWMKWNNTKQESAATLLGFTGCSLQTSVPSLSCSRQPGVYSPQCTRARAYHSYIRPRPIYYRLDLLRLTPTFIGKQTALHGANSFLQSCVKTRSSATAEEPRDALYVSKSMLCFTRERERFQTAKWSSRSFKGIDSDAIR